VQGVVLEITALKDAEAELLNQAKIFEQVHDSVVQTDMTGRIRGWNRGAEQLFGYTFDEIIGEHVSTLYFEEDRANVDSLVLQPLFANGQHDLVLRNRKKDDSECWIRLSVSLLRDATGTPTGMVGYSEDITSRLRAEKALRASEQKYRLLFETSPVGIAVWSDTGLLREANDVLLRMMGWTPEQLADGVLSWNATAGSARGASISKVFQAKQSGTFEEEWTREDGTRFPVLVAVGEANNSSTGTLACVIDLSQQKAAELAVRENRAYLELALEGADLGVWDWNIVTGHVSFNERWATMLGYELSELEPNVTSWERLVHPDDLAPTLSVLRDHLEGRTPSYESEHRMRTKSGQWVWIWDCGKIIERSPDGSPLRAAGTHLDVSGRKHAEIALAHSEQRFRAIFDQVFQLMALLTPAGILLEANNTALEFWNVSREDVVNRPIWDLPAFNNSLESQARLKEAIADAGAGGFIRYEEELRNAEGSTVTFDWSIRPMLDNGGRVSQLIVEGRDVTDLKRGQALLQADREKRRLEAVLRCMTKGVVIADPVGNIISMNPAALALLGIPSEQEAKRHLSQFTEFELRTVDGEEIPYSAYPLSRVLRGESFSGYILEVRRTDTGRTIIAAFGAAPVHDEAGAVILVVQTIRDVTHQHEVEEALRQSNRERDVALQAGRMRTWRWECSDAAGEEIPAKLLMLSFDSAVNSTEQGFASIHPDDQTVVRQFGKRILAAESAEIHYRVRSDAGVFTWLASRGSVIRSERRAVTGLAGVTWDITGRKNAEAEITRMNASLHRLSADLLRLQDQERRRFARELHDGPVQMLSGAAMNLSVLARSACIANSDRDRRLAEECVTWVKQASQEMRSLSYLLHPPILDELGLTSALRGWIVGFADRTGLEVDLNIEEVGRLGADLETALFRIGQEALSNVHRHSLSSTVSVRLHRRDGSILMEVEDSGRGIPPGVLDGRGAAPALGVGIGGMRERARQLGGQLDISSAPDTGTLVRLVLPLESKPL
jgi:PAS domain S-box-containing protein